MMRAGFTIGETDPARGGIPMQHRDGWGGDKRESLTTLFFHYHRPEFTTAGIYKGLVGFFRIFDEMDTGDETKGWRLPSGPYDVPLAIADKRFDRDGNLFFDQFNLDGHLGDKTTVNGKIQPFLR
jgi:FtsP/CotA-like multicopper oxidase with cupredoxin domain